MDAEVLVKFKGDDSDLNAKTNELSSNIGGKLTGALKTGAVAMAAVGTAAVGATKAFWDGVNASAQYGDEIDKTSQKVGLSTDAYQKWDYVMKISGTSMQDCTVGLKTMTNKIDDALNGSEEATAQFERLGISVDDLAGKSREDIFGMVVTGLQGVQDETTKAAIANDFFGKSGQNLIPLFNQTAEETAALMQEAQDYGMVMSEDAVKSSAAFEDSLTKLKGAMTGVKNGIMSNMMPGVTTIMDGFSDLIAGVDGAEDKISEGILAIGEKLSEAVPKIVNGITKMMPSLIKVAGKIIKTLAQAIMQNLPTIIQCGMDLLMDLVMGIIQMMPELIPTIIQCILVIVQALIDNIDLLIEGGIQLTLGLIKGLIQAIPLIIEKMPMLIMGIITGLVSALPEIFGFGPQLVGSMLDGIMSVIGTIPEAFIKAFTLAWEGIQKVFGNVAQFFGSIFSNAWNNVKKVFSIGGKIFEGIKEGIFKVFKTVVNAIIKGINNVVSIPFKAINGALKGIKGINILGAKPFSWLPTIPVPKIPLLNVGTNFVPEDQLAMIHKGEAVIPKKFNPYANNLSPSVLGGMQNSAVKPIINVYVETNTDPIGQTVSNIKTFSGGAKNDYNYGMGV